MMIETSEQYAAAIARLNELGEAPAGGPNETEFFNISAAMQKMNACCCCKVAPCRQAALHLAVVELMVASDVDDLATSQRTALALVGHPAERCCNRPMNVATKDGYVELRHRLGKDIRSWTWR